MVGMGMGDGITPGSEHGEFLGDSPRHGRVRGRVGELEEVSRQGTPRSVRSAREETPRMDLPLVLLHATLLRTACPYSAASMLQVLSEKYGYVLRNWRLLEEKMGETVVARGLLIPHPGEEYDVLEEKLLESLELTMPRISKCGHYCHPQEDEEDQESYGSRCGGYSERDIFADGDDDEDEETCRECRRPIKYPGTGEGTKKWNVRIFAANGMMRAGAWSAAWREMERVDVEIEPWMPDEARRELDRLREEETLLEARRVEEDAAAGRVVAEQLLREAEMEAFKRREEALGEQIRVDSAFSHRTEVPNLSHQDIRQRRPVSQLSARSSRPSTPTRRFTDKIPLSTLLRNYLYLLAQDRRNLVILLLSCTVLFFALSAGTSKRPTLEIASKLQDLPAYTSSAQAHMPTPSSATDVFATASIAPTEVAPIPNPTKANSSEEAPPPPSHTPINTIASDARTPTPEPSPPNPSSSANPSPTSAPPPSHPAPSNPNAQTHPSQSDSKSVNSISSSTSSSRDAMSGQGTVHAAAPRGSDSDGGDATGDPEDDGSSGRSRGFGLAGAEGLDEVAELLSDSL